MAKTKHAHKPVRRRRSHAPLAAKPTHRRKPRKRGLLGDIMNPTIAMNSAKTSAAGAGGGVTSIVQHKLLPAGVGKLGRVGIGFGVSFLAAVFGAPSIGAGHMGGTVALTFQNGMMGDEMEENEFADANTLDENLPIYLEADGTPFVIEEEGGESYTRYLSDDERESIGM